MSISDPAIDHYRSLNPIAFTELDRLEIRQAMPLAGERHIVSIEIILRSGHGSDDPKLHLSFHGIAQFRLTAGSYIQLMRIEILSIHDRHWQGLHYLVHETEEDALYFFCDAFEASVEVNGSEVM